MDLELIEYLENKNFDVDDIRLLQKKITINSSDITIKKFESIYKIFGYANLGDLTINLLIVNNPGLLTKTDSELITIAYSWLDTYLLSEAAERKRGILHELYDRTYLRNIYLNSNIKNYTRQISYNTLILGDGEFSEIYRGTINNATFYPTYENLVSIYGKGNSFEEKKEYIINLINSLAIKWFLDCLRKDKEKQNENRSIQ